MKTQRISIPIEPDEHVSGVFSIPEGYRPGEGRGIIVAHGAGNDMDSPFIVSFCEGLARNGYPALRFNFPYREKGRKSPDSQNVLVRAWKGAYEFFHDHPQYAPGGILAAGKSMGGRVASQMVATGLLSVEGMVFLGYPLHPPGDKEKLRVAHLFQIRVPMLFFAGTRDSLCDLSLLRKTLKKLSVPWGLEVIEGGDHSFHVPQSSGLREEAIFGRILQKTVEWLASPRLRKLTPR
jgi:predicted alpha/beta-hydrolase family hydrolase